MGRMKIPLLDTKGVMSDRDGRKLLCNGEEGIEDGDGNRKRDQPWC